jgi:hypothetical protein
MSPLRAITLATLIVGVHDGLDAIIFFGLRGATPTRIFQAIAAGILGRQAAVQGGLQTALLGVALHFVVAFGIVGTYYLASLKIRALTTHPVICGAIYGVLAYLTMNYVVIPLSAIGPGGPAHPLPVVANGVLIHIFGVGIPTAFIIRMTSRA